ncbi:hypothetical protein PHBOTO_002848 [Pseudozyma hubeiensis]|nr:hypothetical protein PHBOTO_002848 [Pseudozyma hubeiensis]
MCQESAWYLSALRDRVPSWSSSRQGWSPVNSWFGATKIRQTKDGKNQGEIEVMKFYRSTMDFIFRAGKSLWRRATCRPDRSHRHRRAKHFRQVFQRRKPTGLIRIIH